MTFYAITQFVRQDDHLYVLAALGTGYLFTTAAMMIPALSEFDVSLERDRGGGRRQRLSWIAESWLWLVAMGVLILLSALFSGSEAALFSLTPRAARTIGSRGSWRSCRREVAGESGTIVVGNPVLESVDQHDLLRDRCDSRREVASRSRSWSRDGDCFHRHELASDHLLQRDVAQEFCRARPWSFVRPGWAATLVGRRRRQSASPVGDDDQPRCKPIDMA